MRDIEFDCVDSVSALPYGYVKGNGRVVLIKAGRGGDYCGYDNKYLQIAQKLNEKYGYTVICISNPVEEFSVECDREILDRVLSVEGIECDEIRLVGVSNGGIKVLQLGASSLTASRIITVNMPLMVNFYKTVDSICACKGARIVTVYGDRDPSFSYLPFLKMKDLPGVEILTVHGADHQFVGMVSEFIDMTVELLGE